MKSWLTCLIMLAVLAHSTESLFESVEEAKNVRGIDAEINATKAYTEAMKNPHIKYAKVLSVRGSALKEGALIEVVFPEGKSGIFNMKKGDGGSLWKGQGEKLDWFVIRKSGKDYSGQFLYKGRQYVLAPLSKGISIFYQLDGRFECGIKEIEARK